MTKEPNFEAVVAALTNFGLAPRGGFHPSDDDAVPLLSSGAPVRTLVLAGNVGGVMWRRFALDRPAESNNNDAHPTVLDDWSREALAGVVKIFGGPTRCSALFPFTGPPFLPFLRWAQRAEAVFPSPVGALVHPDYGMWHAYRGALAFAGHIDLPPRAERQNPCSNCADKPCLSGCPVGAYSEKGFNLRDCIGHIASASGLACMTRGCLVRSACPVGRQYAYSPGQTRFHMVSFRRSNRHVGSQG